tara:strand:+ start:14914 stop:16260 length:1347 start_codon:yes stop_codon:yes gene_type:complete
MENSARYNEDLLKSVLTIAKKNGAESADAILIANTGINVSCRMGKPEGLEQSESLDIGLRVFIGNKQSLVSTSISSRDTLNDTVSRAISMAKAVPEDPYCGLVETSLFATKCPDLNTTDILQANPKDIFDEAIKAEEEALNVEGVTNSEGSEAGYSHTNLILANSEGFFNQYEYTRHSLSASVIAGSGTDMERDYEFSVACHKMDLLKPINVGKTAGEKAVQRLGARKIQSGRMPVIYDPRVSNSLLHHFSSAVSGTSISRQTSFLDKKLNSPIFSPNINIYDDPHRIRGLRSRPFDGEGVNTNKLKIVSDGVLNSWILDSNTAKQLNLKTTGHASRSTNSYPSPAPSNLYLEAGEVDPTDLFSDISTGLYVTDLMGMGVNLVTGDYSRGASGFMIENGEITHPVSEITIAGNLGEMFQKLSPANDLVFKYGIDAPTIRIEDMMVAGR